MSKKVSHSLDFFPLHFVENSVEEAKNNTYAFFESTPEITSVIDNHFVAFRRIMDIVPTTVQNMLSGNLFPYIEAETELNASLYFASRGFYKQAINGLRNVLELGLLNVYWDIDDKSYIDIKDWLRSKEDTPFRKKIKRRLLENANIRKFNEIKSYFDQIDNIYLKLSNFTHTKGARHSSRALNQSNINTFNEKSFRIWVDSLTQVVQLVLIAHILKYPVAYQYTPIDDKFGLNGPAGGFLNPYQVTLVKKIFDESTNTLLQEISDTDPDAIQAAEWVNNMPDITEKEMDEQLIQHDKDYIPHLVGGFPKWLKDHRKMMDMHKKNGETKELRKLEKHLKIITKWAESEGLTKKTSK